MEKIPYANLSRNTSPLSAEALGRPFRVRSPRARTHAIRATPAISRRLSAGKSDASRLALRQGTQFNWLIVARLVACGRFGLPGVSARRSVVPARECGGPGSATQSDTDVRARCEQSIPL